MTPGFRARATGLGALLAAAGVLLLAVTLWRTGAAPSLRSVERMGVWGFAGILALSGLRLAIRSLAWVRCVERPARLHFRDAFRATLVGEAFSALTPLANVLGEPAKAMFVRRRVPLDSALAALVVENMFYGASAAVAIALGTVVFLIRVDPSDSLRWAAYAAIIAVVAALGAVIALLGAGVRPVSQAIAWLHRRGLAPASLADRRETVVAFETRINQFSARNRGRLLPLLLLEGGFHLASIAEVSLTLRLVGGPVAPTLVNALILDSAGRAITVVFRFIPMRLGVDEAGNALIAHALGLGAPTGVALALMRKARIASWTAGGLALMLHRGLSGRPAAQNATARRPGRAALDAASPSRDDPW